MSFSDLPLAHQIIDVEALKRTLQRECKKKGDDEPDKRLQNWQKWLDDHRKTGEALAEKTRREPCELLLNYAESMSTIKNDKRVLEYTRIPYPHDKYRGNPSFFETPTALKRIHPEDSDYFAVRTKENEHLIPEVQYVDVPRPIKEERGIAIDGYRKMTDGWLRSAYRKERVKVLEEKLSIVEPYKPEMEELCMIGRKVKSPTDDFQVSYKARKVKHSDKGSTKTRASKSRRNRHANEEYIKINKLRLCPHVKRDEMHLYLDFNLDLASKKPLTKTITILNATNTAIRYSFIPIKTTKLFTDIVQKDKWGDQVFFFDRRTNILPPNDQTKFYIHFKSNVSRFFNLHLKLNMTPKLFTTTVLIQLSGNAEVKDLNEKIDRIKKRIDEKVRNTTVHDVLKDILQNVPGHESHITLFTYDRGYIFEAVNQKFSAITRRPKYIYNKEVVDELEAFYLKIRFKGFPPYWNYDIEDLRKAARQRDKYNRQRDALDQIYLMRLQELHQKMLNGENIDAEVEKIEKKKLIKVKLSDDRLTSPISDRIELLIKKLKEFVDSKKTETQSLTAELDNILLKLDTTSYCANHMYDSYSYAYAALCIAFDRIETEINKLKDVLQIKTFDRYPLHLNNHLSLEPQPKKVFMDENLPSFPKLEQDFAQIGNPPTELLKDIPHEKVKERHEAYFGVEAQKKVKEKKGKKEKKKGKKSDKGSKKSKDKKDKKGNKDKKKKAKDERPPTPQADLKPIPHFEDPFKQQSEMEISIHTTPSRLTIDSVTSIAIEPQLDTYKTDIYKIFYKHLSEAVTRVVDVVEMDHPRKLKLAEFKEIWRRKSINAEVRYIDLKQTVTKVIGIKAQQRKAAAEEPHEKKQREMILREPLRPKETGSLWSLLRGSKQPSPPDKPISYPERNLLIRWDNQLPETRDIGTVMSECSGFNPAWVDVKEESTQVGPEGSWVPVTWESKGVAAGVVEEIIDDIYERDSRAKTVLGHEEEDEGLAQNEVGEGVLSYVGEREETDSDVFFDEDFSDSETNVQFCDLFGGYKSNT